MGQILSGIKRFILWDYARATWQYDVMVGVILAFIFLTPKTWFRDQPRVPQANRIALLPANHGHDVFWIEADLLAATPETEQKKLVSDMLKHQTGVQHTVVSIEPIIDSEEETRGYIVYTKP